MISSTKSILKIPKIHWAKETPTKMIAIFMKSLTRSPKRMAYISQQQVAIMVFSYLCTATIQITETTHMVLYRGSFVSHRYSHREHQKFSLIPTIMLPTFAHSERENENQGSIKIFPSWQTLVPFIIAIKKTHRIEP